MNNIEIIPAVVPLDKLKTVELITQIKGFSDILQIDVGDGEFTKHKTLSIDIFSESLFSHVDLEAQLMVRDLQSEVERWVPYRPKRIILHVESKPSAFLIQQIQHEGIEVGIGICAETDIAVLQPYLHLVNNFLFLSISPPGEQGRPFIPEVLQKIKSFHTKYPAAVIEVDGGVDENTMMPLVRAGATRLAIGSGIFSADRSPAEQYVMLRQIMLEYTNT